MRTRRTLTLALLLVPFLHPGCGGGEGGPEGEPPPTVLVATGVGVEATARPDAPTTVSLGEEAALTVPAGAISAPAPARITPVEPPAEMNLEGLVLGKVYDFAVGDQARFDEELTVEVAYDPSRIPEGLSPEDAVHVVYFEDAIRSWVVVPCEVDAARGRAIARLDHLTPVAPATVETGTAVMQHTHLRLEYDRGYGKNVPKGSIDRYASWVRGVFVDSWNAYESAFGKANMPKGKVTARFSEVQDPQWSVWTGVIHIPYQASGGEAQTRWEVAHELFHALQNRRYKVSEMDANRWFMEATAEYAACRIAEKKAGVPTSVPRAYLLHSYRHIDSKHEYQTARFLEFLFPDPPSFLSMWRAVQGTFKTHKKSAEAALAAHLKSGAGKSLTGEYARFLAESCFDPAGAIPVEKASDFVQGLDTLPLSEKRAAVNVSLWRYGMAALYSVRVSVPDGNPGRRPVRISADPSLPAGQHVFVKVATTLKESPSTVVPFDGAKPLELTVEGEATKVFVLAVNLTESRQAYQIVVEADAEEKKGAWHLVAVEPKATDRAPKDRFVYVTSCEDGKATTGVTWQKGKEHFIRSTRTWEGLGKTLVPGEKVTISCRVRTEVSKDIRTDNSRLTMHPELVAVLQLVTREGQILNPGDRTYLAASSADATAATRWAKTAERKIVWTVPGPAGKKDRRKISVVCLDSCQGDDAFLRAVTTYTYEYRE